MESKIALIFLAVIMLIFAWNVFGFLGKLNDTAKNKKAAEEKIAELEKVKGQLSADIANLKTEKGVEASIREKFGLAKEGEGMIVVVDENNTKEAKEKEKGGFFSFWKNLFK